MGDGRYVEEPLWWWWEPLNRRHRNRPINRTMGVEGLEWGLG